MRGNELLDKMELIDFDFVEAADEMPKAKRSAWIKRAAAAACLCLVLISTVAILLRNPETSQRGNPPDCEEALPPHIIADGKKFFISPYRISFVELPEGYAYAGKADVGGWSDVPYYTNPEKPEWIYAYHEVETNGEVDATGTFVKTEPHMAYVRYVDERLRGKDLLFCNGNFYISMSSVDYFGDMPDDVTPEYYESVARDYGISIEGNAPEGFAFAGTTAFSGYDTIPGGTFSSNVGEKVVYLNADVPDIALVATEWYTAAKSENKETIHNGFDVYIRCEMTPTSIGGE